MENSLVYARIRFEVKISEDSTLVQFVSLRADLPYIRFDTTVEWKESHKFLKVPSSLNVFLFDFHTVILCYLWQWSLWLSSAAHSKVSKVGHPVGLLAAALKLYFISYCKQHSYQSGMWML